MAYYHSRDDHELMKPKQKPGYDLGEVPVDMPKQHAKREFHELQMKPSKETLTPSRRLIQLVNRDEVFVLAKRTLGLFPQVAYKLVKAAGTDRARMVTAFIISLFQSDYFTVDQKGRYDPSIPGSQERARNMLMGILYGKKPIYLSYAGKYFFEVYPEMREVLRENADATV
jgi:hypothetical protein